MWPSTRRHGYGQHRHRPDFLEPIAPSSAGVIALGIDDTNSLNFNTVGLQFASLGTISGSGETLSKAFTYSGMLIPFGTQYILGGGGGTLNVTSTLADAAAGSTSVLITLNGTTTPTTAVGSPGSATVILANSGNSYTGTTTIFGTAATAATTPVLEITADSDLGMDPSGPTTATNIFINGGELFAANTFSLNVNRNVAIGPASGSGTGAIDVYGLLTLSGLSNVTDPYDTLTVDGNITNNGAGTGQLVVNTQGLTGSQGNHGSLVLNGADTYSGGTKDSSAASALEFDDPSNTDTFPASLPTSGTLTIGAGVTVADGLPINQAFVNAFTPTTTGGYVIALGANSSNPLDFGADREQFRESVSRGPRLRRGQCQRHLHVLGHVHAERDRRRDGYVARKYISAGRRRRRPDLCYSHYGHQHGGRHRRSERQP